MSAELQQVVNDLGVAFEQFKAANDAALNEIKSKGATDPVLAEKVERINTEISNLTSLKDRLEKLETIAARPSFGGAKGEVSEIQVRHAGAFVNFMRNKGDHQAAAELRAVEKEAIQQKAVATTSDAAGGYAVPTVIASEIARLVNELSPMRQVARVVSVGTPEYKELVDVLGTTSGWVGETDSRTKTN